jgi:hypothetical protein
MADPRAADSKFEAVFREMPRSYASIARTLRHTLRQSAPSLVERVKWNQPFWVGRADVLCFQCSPDHLNLGILRGAELVDRFPGLEGTGKSMRHLKVRSVAEARSPTLRRLVRAAVALDSQD